MMTTMPAYSWGFLFHLACVLGAWALTVGCIMRKDDWMLAGIAAIVIAALLLA